MLFLDSYDQHLDTDEQIPEVDIPKIEAKRKCEINEKIVAKKVESIDASI